jgi:hypothetical protein
MKAFINLTFVAAGIIAAVDAIVNGTWAVCVLGITILALNWKV